MASAPVPPGSPVHVVTSVRVPKLPLAEPLPSAVAVNSVSRPSASTLAASAAARQAQLRNTRKSFVPTGALISFAFMPPPVVAPPPLPAPPQPSKPPVVDEVVKHETVHQAVTPSSPGTPAVSKPAGTGGGGGSARPPAPVTGSVQVKPGGIVVRQVRLASSDSSSLHAPFVPPPPLSSRSSSPPELALRGGSIRSPPPHASSLASSSPGVGPSLAKRARLMSPPGSSATTTHTGSSLASALGFPLPPIAASQANSPVVGGGATLRSPPPTGSKRA
ncbi:hypothetical protein BCR44DRAFT_1443878 [Catenaria anguillulae PL171]|uniref:Uncharacterized protein n=1 Tax=Catenaria anguillulae PL171 TaxID=765915 RepID=A0A1Y2H8A3_9FUNG|nr:hypothetical protein BCR44DRAFT_1443878 [Catenaria anguillulae PL171]